MLKQITKAVVERALQTEMAAHLGHAKNEAVTNPAGNARNGKNGRTLKGDGELPIEIFRDRHGSFELQLIPNIKPAGLDSMTRVHGMPPYMVMAVLKQK